VVVAGLLHVESLRELDLGQTGGRADLREGDGAVYDVLNRVDARAALRRLRASDLAEPPAGA
jgi:hypothetical protein